MSLLDDVKILNTPNATKTGKLYSIKPDTGLGDLDITRSTTATRLNSSGVVESVAVNAPQLDYTESSCPSFLIEPQSTNLHLYSEEIDNAAYLKSDVTVSANAIISPDGTTNADECTTTSNFAQMYQAITLAASTTYTWSFYVKRGTMTDIGQQIFNMNGDGEYGTGGKYYSQTTATGWARVSFTFTTGSNGGTTRFYPINASGVTGTIYLWGFQLESKSFATSYIPTVSSSVTRNLTSFLKTGLSSLIGQTEGVFFIEIKYFGVPSGQNFLSIGQYFGGNNSVNIGNWGGNFSASLYFNNTTLFLNTNVATVDTNFHKIAIKYKSGDSAIWMDGVEVFTYTTTGTPSASGFDTMSSKWGNLMWSIESIKLKQLQVYNTILTDSQLLTLTT